MSAKKLLRKRISKRAARLANASARANNTFTYEELVNAESALGRTLFGPIPEGCRREFFESKPNVWIWHESFVNKLGRMEEMTIRYEVRPTGVYKKPVGGAYERLEGIELDNFRRAARGYLNLVKSKLYC
jgi:hypothetical protein